MAKVRVIVDGFGGDNAPLAVLQGSVRASKELNAAITLTGDEAKLRACAEENGLSLENIQIRNCSGVITNEDSPKDVLKKNSDTSMAVGMRMLAAGEGDAFLSAGSTGAIVMGSTFIVKRIRGVSRPCLGTVIPTKTGCCLLLDVGANAECRPEFLVQFAHMGSYYMRSVLGVASPRIGLLNIGAEEKKGAPLQQETYALLKSSSLNFAGNVEARDVLFGSADVIVSDGFSGNVLLKSMEGAFGFLMKAIKATFMSSLKTKLAALLVKKDLSGMKKQFDYSEYGGAPLMGVDGAVIKAHGSSNDTAIFNAIRQAVDMVEGDIVGQIRDYASTLKGGDTEHVGD